MMLMTTMVMLFIILMAFVLQWRSTTRPSNNMVDHIALLAILCVSRRPPAIRHNCARHSTRLQRRPPAIWQHCDRHPTRLQRRPPAIRQHCACHSTRLQRRPSAIRQHCAHHSTRLQRRRSAVRQKNDESRQQQDDNDSMQSTEVVQTCVHPSNSGKAVPFWPDEKKTAKLLCPLFCWQWTLLHPRSIVQILFLFTF